VILLVVAVVILAVVVSLATVPVAKRQTYEFQGNAPPANPLGCSDSLAGTQSFPAGKTIQVSWAASSGQSVSLIVVDQPTGSGVFSGTGISGSGSFWSNGVAYQFYVSNCGSQSVPVSVWAYYNFAAPYF